MVIARKQALAFNDSTRLSPEPRHRLEAPGWKPMLHCSPECRAISGKCLIFDCDMVLPSCVVWTDMVVVVCWFRTDSGVR